ncbi:MAG: HIT family protein [Nanoarchaeota archaeon]|nr:HIT family protein [Nanoarchaeota archaeon]MCG2719062.1 HIT family protein [Nanoarchaeota archaeon]
MALTQEKLAAVQQQLAGLPPEEQQKKLQELLTPEEMAELQAKQCPFCGIASGQIPAKTVYEDDMVKAVLDINPANKGHILIFPKQHYQFLFMMPDNEVARIFQVANKLAKVAFEAVGAQGTNIFVANGQVAGQNAPHVLVHVIPRFENDGVGLAWQPKKIEEAEMDEVVKKLTEHPISIGEEAQPAVIEEVKVEKEETEETQRIP